MQNKTFNLLKLCGLLALCFLVSAFGAQFTPGEWYQSLQRAPWNPPNITFPIVWFFLYCTIAVAGWRIFLTHNLPLKLLWVIQLILNAAWSWLFFGQQWITIALIEIIVLLIIVGLLTSGFFKQEQKIWRWLLVPYLLWLALATSLNAYIVIFN